MSTPIEQNTTALQGILDAVNALPTPKPDPVLQEKTVTPSTSSQSITPDGGYDALSKVTVNAMPTATQATPSISVSSGGLITASATQTAGYVAAGTKSATKQLTTQAAKTITPSTSSQTAVASGRYTTGTVTVAAIPSTYVKPTATKAATTYTPKTTNQTIAAGTYCSGAQTIKGDSNLVASNIKKGVSIFGVSGSYEESTGGAAVETCTVKAILVNSESDTDGGRLCNIAYFTTFENGEITADALTSPDEVGTTFENVVRNSGFLMDCRPGEIITENCSLMFTISTGSSRQHYLQITGDAFIKMIGSKPCVARDTQISLANNSSKLVQDITYDDELLVWDFNNACYCSAKPLWIKKVQTSTYYYRCEFENGVVLNLVGSNGKCHRVFNVDKNSFESATDCVGSMVAVQNGVSRLISCERVDESVEFYNIITEYHLNLFANSVLTSCRLNNLYPIKDMKFVKDDRPTIPMEAYVGVDDSFYYGLRLGEQKSENVESVNEYVKRLQSLMA